MPWNQERSKETRFKKNPQFADRSFLKPCRNGGFTSYVRSGCRGCASDIPLRTFKRGGLCCSCRKEQTTQAALTAQRLRDTEKLPYKEMAARLGVRLSKVSALLRRVKYGTIAQSPKAFVADFLPKHCELCGYSRVVEMAHIIAKAKGGTNDLHNFLALCPNCHYLFDNLKLTVEEDRTIVILIERRRNQVFLETENAIQ